MLRDTALHLGALAACVALAAQIRGAEEAPSAAQVREWIIQLDHENFEQREAAARQLRAAGEVAVPQLKKAAKDSESAEVRTAASKLVSDILVGDTFARQVASLDSPNAEISDEALEILMKAIEQGKNNKEIADELQKSAYPGKTSKTLLEIVNSISQLTSTQVVAVSNDPRFANVGITSSVEENWGTIEYDPQHKAGLISLKKDRLRSMLREDQAARKAEKTAEPGK